MAPESKGTAELISPYCGKLINLVVDREQHDELTKHANNLTTLQLSPRLLCDFELLSIGAFSPLDRFMGKADYTQVLEKMRLRTGALFPIPITLPVHDITNVRLGDEIALRNLNNDLLAVMTVEEMFERSPTDEAHLVLGTTDVRHPLLAEMDSWGRTFVSGSLKVLSLPKHYDFREFRKTPNEVRKILQAVGTSNVIALQLPDADDAPQEFISKKVAEVDCTFLIQPPVGLIKPGDVYHYTRLRDYKALVEGSDENRFVLNLLPVATRMAGHREALWRAIIARNYGANSFMSEANYAFIGRDSHDKPSYREYEAEKLFEHLAPEIGVRPVNLLESALLPYQARIRRKKSAHQQGFCVWFTGLSGAGKSTLSEILTILLMEHGREVTLLDGDVVRTHLSKGLGFSKQDRNTNVLRIGFVASEIVRHGGAVVCAAVSPYRASRSQCRHMIGHGRFIEIFVDTPLEIRERRDTKGMYAQARGQEVRGFSGKSDSYEQPLDPDIHLTTMHHSPEEDAQRILRHLIDRGFLQDT